MRPVPPEKPPPAPLYDGEVSRFTVSAARHPEVRREVRPSIFGPRVIIVIALTAHAGLAAILVPKMIRALDRIWLSSGTVALRPMQFVPVVMIGALAFGVFLWAWVFRGKGWAITFCLLSAAFWVALCFAIF